ncbi:26S proteasome non-ATPase regulatory subunit 6, partial [Blyttiomyces sp. JEL0837]
MSENQLAKVPNLDLAQSKFVLARGPKELHENAKKALIEGIKQDQMGPYYQSLVEEFKWTPDAALVASLTALNTAEIARLDAKIEDATANLGETDISDALIAKAEYLAKIGEKDKALTAFKVAYEKTGPLGGRIDMVFAMIRIGLFFNDDELISRNIEKARGLIDEGGDWDRRNRLKVYEGSYKISI